jgi:uncharacterized spore protein YtfJ
MEAEIQTMLDSFADLREKANVNAAFGEPVTAEDRTVIPVAKVAYGFGMGTGHGTMAEEETTGETTEGTTEGTGTGGGGGALAHPFAVVEVTPDGIRVEPIVDEQKLALAGSLLIGWSVFWLARALVKIFGRQE